MNPFRLPRRLVVWLLCLVSCWINPCLAGEKMTRSAYSFPFSSYGEWLAFMDKAQDPNWQAKSVKRWVSEAEFTQYQDSSLVQSERIVYQSDGLAIKGFLFTPTDSTRTYPVVIFLHGGVAQ